MKTCAEAAGEWVQEFKRSGIFVTADYVIALSKMFEQCSDFPKPELTAEELIAHKKISEAIFGTPDPRLVKMLNEACDRLSEEHQPKKTKQVWQWRHFSKSLNLKKDEGHWEVMARLMTEEDAKCYTVYKHAGPFEVEE